MKTSGAKKINFGCGTTRIEGWINVDKNLKHLLLTGIPGFFGLLSLLRALGLLLENNYEACEKSRFISIRYGDVRKKLCFKDNSIDYIYASHLLEHLFFTDAMNFLRECYRILKLGGLIRIVIPDLEGAARKYLSAIDDNIASVESTEQLVHVFFDKFEKNIMSLIRFYRVMREHHWMYDRVSLSEYLTRVGFHDIRVCEFRKGKCPDIDVLDSKPDSLFIEAMK